MWYTKASADKTLIIMRGLPGSGKSSLAEQLGKNGLVLSTDDLFMEDGNYNFDPTKLKDYHLKTISNAEQALASGISPIVIDNTNTRLYEMKPYVNLAQQYGYNVQFEKPQTPWAWDTEELAKRNSHEVPLERIQELHDGFDESEDLDEIKQSYAPWEKDNTEEQ